MDRITIRGLRVDTRIGVGDDERARPRPVSIDIELDTDLRRAGRSDDLGDTVDYDELASRVAELVRSSEVRLLEHLAEKIASLLAGLSIVQRVSVEVTKEAPPTAEEVRGVAVRIERPAR